MFKNLFSILALVAIIFFINPKPAQAAVSDCASQDCVAVCTSSGVAMYFTSNGTSAGTITGVGTGACYLSADEGHLIINRTSGTTYIYNVQNGTQCDFAYAGQNALVFGSHAYVTSGANHRIARVNLSDCSGYTEISVPGTYPWGITKDATTIYVMNSQTADITMIVPPSTTPAYNSIGRVFGDQMLSVKYHSGSNKLYASGLAGLYEVSLPLSGTSTLWQALPSSAEEMSLTDTHIGVQSLNGNSAYLVPMATPASYYTMSCTNCRSIALDDTGFFTAGGNIPDGNVRAWNMSGAQESYSPILATAAYSVAHVAPTVSAPVCPNGTKETGEACDGTQFGTTTCQTLGFDGGSLTCTGTCTIDSSSCFYNCGNGSIDSGEDCDGTNLNNQGCTDLGFDSGPLSCSGSCEFVTTSCVTATCNNGSIDSGEDCDGSNLSGASCTSLGYDSGDLSCSPTSCTFDTTSCVTDLCGNGTLDMGEQCDTTNFGGESCQSQGFDSGTLSCSGSCTLNTSACTNDVPLCGNGLLDTGEQCDDNGTAAGDGCSDTCQIEDDYTCEGEPSDCSLIEETCNPNGLVADSTSGLDFQKLSSHNLDLYNSHLNTETGLTKGHTLTCGTVEVFGNPLEAITVNLASGTYADLAIKIGDKVAQCHFFAEEGAAKIHINANNTKKFFVDGESGSGAICTEDNANVEIQFQGLILAALGTGLSGRKLAIHPLSNLSGNWLEVYVSDATVRLIEMAVSTNNIVVATSDMVNGRPLYLNLDAIGDLTEIFTPPTTTPPKGCGCSTGSNNGTSTLPIAFLSIFILLMIRRRKVFGSR